MHFYFIINPLSGNGAGLKVWKHLSALLQHEQFSFEYHITGNSGHAKQLAADAAAQAADAVIVLGGDGTLHEAANGLLSSKHFNPEITALSVLPLGTGNDFAAAYGIKKDVQALLTRCKQPKYRWQDVICIKNAADEIHYCVSMAGWGFDAYVARLVNEQKAKGKRGKWLYLKAALETVRQYKPVTIQLSNHEKVIEIEMLSGAGGIHRSNGGGLLQCPQALPDDGLIHISIIKPLTLCR
jgi:YegS/Rv2252/BmrU family lipid kinase